MGDEVRSADLPIRAGMDGALRQRLKALGFTAPYNAEHGRLVKEWFDRPGLRVSVYPQGESDGAAEHAACAR